MLSNCHTLSLRVSYGFQLPFDWFRTGSWRYPVRCPKSPTPFHIKVILLSFSFAPPYSRQWKADAFLLFFWGSTYFGLSWLLAFHPSADLAFSMLCSVFLLPEAKNAVHLSFLPTSEDHVRPLNCGTYLSQTPPLRPPTSIVCPTNLQVFRDRPSIPIDSPTALPPHLPSFIPKTTPS